jgi:hypothetical protein
VADRSIDAGDGMNYSPEQLKPVPATNKFASISFKLALASLLIFILLFLIVSIFAQFFEILIFRSVIISIIYLTAIPIGLFIGISGLASLVMIIVKKQRGIWLSLLSIILGLVDIGIGLIYVLVWALTLYA